MKKVLIVALVGIFLITGCKKDSNSNCDLNASNMAASYKITSVKMGGVEIFTDDTFFDPCSRDDIQTFNSDGTYTVTDAGVVCSPSGDDSGTWSLNGNVLVMDGENFGVSNFTCSGFQFTYDYVDPNDPSLNFSLLFTLARV